jgi:hypothetical protein
MWKKLKRWPVLLALLVVLGGLAVGLVFLSGSRVTMANAANLGKRNLADSPLQRIQCFTLKKLHGQEGEVSREADLVNGYHVVALERCHRPGFS